MQSVALRVFYTLFFVVSFGSLSFLDRHHGFYNSQIPDDTDYQVVYQEKDACVLPLDLVQLRVNRSK